ncbi:MULTISPECIES: glycosyltransferase [Calothrix]|uniref:Glycosyltransferase family 2 protein n=3 Tax=Calothrix TaxID=1186 RepID=A0ABR8AJX0_9CYAN|nr:glycosyltransferase family A protein [Calothrix anomala]MBD2200204.1 glycosyltransferase family 2 protein [Calothrix parietina FACHB-288]MBD2229177.1 glycosyltransferase family 2 protein [Calothrix anomala FACHB-343]
MLEQNVNLSKFVSVIIPVFNDAERLKICLLALEQQTYPKNLYEVIVVDNASEEDIKSIVEQFDQTVFTQELKTGSYAARNQGISLAKGEILAFTDSDCIPSTSWIENGVKTLTSTPNCGLVAGRIDLFFQNPEKPTPVELYESIAMDFPQERSLKKSHYGVTANIFTFKSVIDTVGCFNDTLKSGGDMEWGQRVFAAGYQQIYADSACIGHPARYSFSQLHQRVARIVGGRHDRMMNTKPSFKEIGRDLLDTFKPPFRSFYRIWSDEKLHGFNQKLQFTGVMLFIRYVTISEKLRLYMGGKSKRA